MEAIDKFQAYLMTADAFLAQHDNYLREIHAIKVENTMLDQYGIGEFQREAKERIDQNRTAIDQADEMCRGAAKQLTALTGKLTVDEVRKHVSDLKVALGKIAEARTRVSSAKADFEVYKNHRKYGKAVKKDLEEAGQAETHYTEYALSLVPETYNPRATIITT
jgi:uncharacterized protein YigA (DUF484 family)